MAKRKPKMTPAEKFFWEGAEWSYSPSRESKSEGRRRSATNLALAEAWFRKHKGGVEWSEDEWADRSGVDHDGPMFQAFARVQVGEDTVTASLGGIDFGDGVGPSGSGGGAARQAQLRAYGRVIEAELASECMAEAGRLLGLPRCITCGQRLPNER